MIVYNVYHQQRWYGEFHLQWSVPTLSYKHMTVMISQEVIVRWHDAKLS